MSGEVPKRPLLSPWYRVVGNGDRLLLEHGQAVVALEGAAVGAFLPRLLPLLDGTRTVEELAARLGPQVRPAIEGALRVLGEHGLLVEGPEAPGPARATAHAVASSYGITPVTAAGRLAGASVGLVGSSPAAADVARLLHLAGIGRVRRLSWNATADVDLAVVVPAFDESDALPRWNRIALDRGIRWLLVRSFDGLLCSVGPLVIPRETCCYRCVLLRRAAHLEHGEDLDELEAAPLAATADAGLEVLLAAVTAHLVVRWLGGRDGTVPGVLYTVTVSPALALEEHDVLRVPRCDECSPTATVAPPLPWHQAAA